MDGGVDGAAAEPALQTQSAHATSRQRHVHRHMSLFNAEGLGHYLAGKVLFSSRSR